MAAGSRNKSGNRDDFAKHYSIDGDGKQPICKQKNYGYSTHDITDVDCKKCLKEIIKNK